MYETEHQELGTSEPVVDEAIVDDTEMSDPEGAVEATPAAEASAIVGAPAIEEASVIDEAVIEEAPVIEEGSAEEQIAEEALGEEALGEETEAPGPARKDNRNWFVVHTYSGYENKVKANLERRIHSMGMQDKIFRVLVPMEDEVEFKDGKRKITPKKVFPGYVLVEMIMDDQSWYVVRNTQGVTGFVGSPGPGEKPNPLQEKEVKTILKQMGIEAPKLKIDFKKGDRVKVTSGPFFDFTGVVDEIAPEKERLRALISIFGRETPVELEFFQVEKV